MLQRRKTEVERERFPMNWLCILSCHWYVRSQGRYHLQLKLLISHCTIGRLKTKVIFVCSLSLFETTQHDAIYHQSVDNLGYKIVDYCVFLNYAHS